MDVLLVTFPILFSFFLIGCGVIFLYGIVISLKQGLESMFWPATAGTIISSQVSSRATEIPANQRAARKLYGKRIVVYYGALIRYEYTVTEALYQADTFNIAMKAGTELPFIKRIPLFGARQRLKAIVAKYPPDLNVTVYYNPKNPAKATLETGVSIYTMTHLLGWTIFCFGGAWLFFVIG